MLNPNHRSPNIQNNLAKNLIVTTMLKVFVCISKSSEHNVFFKFAIWITFCYLYAPHFIPQRTQPYFFAVTIQIYFYEYRNLIQLLVSWSLQTFHLVLICSLQFFKQMRCADGSFMCVFHMEESGRKPCGRSRKQ